MCAGGDGLPESAWAQMGCIERSSRRYRGQSSTEWIGTRRTALKGALATLTPLLPSIIQAAAMLLRFGISTELLLRVLIGSQ